MLPFVALVILAGCEASSGSAQFSDSEINVYNGQVEKINDGWKKFSVASSDCSTAAHAASCFETALDSSGLAQALERLRSTVVKYEFKVDPGDCRLSLERFNTELSSLQGTLDLLKGDDLRAVAMAPEVRRGWEGVVRAAYLAADKCS
jgi:hypothetical protein